MKRLMILGLVYVIGGISGVIFHSVTSGAANLETTSSTNARTP
jgi:hypothetical protein